MHAAAAASAALWLALAAVATAATARHPPTDRVPHNAELRAPAPSPAHTRAVHAPGGAGAPRVARSARASGWADLIASFAQGGAGAGAWFPQPVSVDLPLGTGAGRSSVPLLVVPVPVPVPGPAAPAASCEPRVQPADYAERTSQRGHEAEAEAKADYDRAQNSIERPRLWYIERRPLSDSRVVKTEQVSTSEPARASEWLPTGEAPPPPSSERAPAGDTAPTRPRAARTAPSFEPVEDTELLVKMFRDQVKPNVDLPPIVLPVDKAARDGAPSEVPLELASGEPRGAGAGARQCQWERAADAEWAPVAGPTPPPPRFDRSLRLSALLTAPRAGYTEPYTLWWDAASGAARVDFHGGSTGSYRSVGLDGLMRSVLVREDRSGETPVRRCVLLPPRRATQAERAMPALPDLAGFSFAGYIKTPENQVERWVRTVQGGARGEALTFRHELLVRRPDNFTTAPLRYSLWVDSAALGRASDGYVHRFTEVRYMHHDADLFTVDAEETCEAVERTASVTAVEPLREFAALQRDPRYETEHARYRKNYERRYANDVEEAVRKTVLIQTIRLVDSGNRQGATFALGVNFLADRLMAEREQVQGAAALGAPGLGALPFPFGAGELAQRGPRLPRRFDWRERGGVTHVRNQGVCASCWAFAVTGAVEGALFVRSRRLVPLSEQALVDCAHRFGGRDCRPTWPSNAFKYVQDRGLPALADYTPYQGKRLQCEEERAPPVTLISGHYNVTPDNVVALKTAISRFGPTVVIINGRLDTFTLYSKGIYSDAQCGIATTHAVLAVGWGVRDAETHFALKNSWGEGWGERGYVRMRASGNTCGLLRRASVPRLQPTDLRRLPPDAQQAARL